MDRPAPGGLQAQETGGGAAAPGARPVLAAPALDERTAGRSVPAAATQNVEAARSQFGRLDIVVRSSNGSTKGPVEGAIVAVDQAVSPQFLGALDAGGVARTDASGRASFHVLPTRTVAVTATPPAGGLTTEAAFTSPFEGRSRTVVLEIAVPSMGDAVEFRVVSVPSMRPLAGARIDAGVSLFAVTDEGGRAVLPRSAVAGVEISAPDHATAAIGVPADHGHGTPFVVGLNRHARLFGQLELPENGPVQAAVILYRAREFGPEEKALVERSGVDVPRVTRSVERVDVSADGRWEIGGIEIQHGETAAGGFDLWVERGTNLLELQFDGRRLALDLDLEPGEARRVDDPWAFAFPAEVVVRYASGARVESSMSLILFEDDGSGAVQQVTSASVKGGRARFERLPHGTWYYHVINEGRTWSASADLPTFVHDGAASAEIVLEGFGAIAGRVVGDWYERLREPSEGRTAPTRSRQRAVVVLNNTRILSLDSDGLFRFERVAAGELVEISVGAHVTSFGSDDVGEFVVGSEFVPFATVQARTGDLDVVLEVRAR